MLFDFCYRLIIVENTNISAIMWYMQQFVWMGANDMQAELKQSVEKKRVLAKALINAGKSLGLTQDEVGDVVGRDRSSFSRGIEPETKSGELALMLIRCYRSLYAMVGGDDETIKHWMQTSNKYFNDIPANQIKSISGLVAVVDYLDAIRGKV